MKLQHYAAVLLFTIGWFAAGTASAQDTGLAGNWVLAHKTSLSGVDYVNTVDSVVQVAKKGNQWTLARTNQGVVTTEVLPEGAQPVVSTTKDNRQRTIKVTWNGERAFSEDKSFSAPNAPDKSALHIRDEYSLSADGKTLTVTRFFENVQDANDKWSAKGEYTRK